MSKTLSAQENPGAEKKFLPASKWIAPNGTQKT